MTREVRFGVLWAVVSSLAAAGIFVVVLPLAYAARFPSSLDLGRIPAGLTTGFYPSETDGERTWTWTGARAEVSWPGLDRRVGWRWTLVPLVWRPAGSAMPEVIVSADGVVLHRQTIRTDLEPLQVVIPPSANTTGLRLTIEVEPTFMPSPADTRPLGIALASVTVGADAGTPAVPRAALFNGLLAVAIVAVGLALLGGSGPGVVALATIAAIGQAWILTRGFAVYLDYPLHVAILAGALAPGSVAVLWLVGRLRRGALGPLARLAVAVTVLACYLKLLILLHPGMPIGDGLFHAHRFEQVLRGDLYFTSLAPGSFAFPYPVMLYVMAAPFSFLTDDTLGRVALLRIVVTVADAAAALFVYGLVARSVADARVALASVVWYHLMPVTAWIMLWGNLTNAFAQAWFVAALALIVVLPIDWRRPRTVIVVAAVAATAQLSHPSASAILLVAMVATAWLYGRRGSDELRGAARGVWVAALAATAVATLLYYAWFPMLYVSELDRVASAVAEPAAAEASTFGRRLELLEMATLRFFAWPAMVAALVGLWRLTAVPAPRRLTLLLAGLAAACLLFVGLGLLTPIDLRTHLAAAPAVAVLAAAGSVWAFGSRGMLRAGAVVTFFAGCWVAGQSWLDLLW